MRQVYSKLPTDAHKGKEFNKRKFPFVYFPHHTGGEEEFIALAALTNITSCLISGDHGGYVFLGFAFGCFKKLEKNIGCVHDVP